jgi:hypothetical protein
LFVNTGIIIGEDRGAGLGRAREGLLVLLSSSGSCKVFAAALAAAALVLVVLL